MINIISSLMLYCIQTSYLASDNYYIIANGLDFPEKIQAGGISPPLPPPGISHFFYFSYPWKIQTQQSSTPEYSTNLCQIPSWEFQDQKQRPLEIPRKCYFFDTPAALEIPYPQPPSPAPYLDFFPISPPLAAWKFHFLKLTPPSCPVWLFSGITHSKAKGRKSRPEKFCNSFTNIPGSSMSMPTD